MKKKLEKSSERVSKSQDVQGLEPYIFGTSNVHGEDESSKIMDKSKSETLENLTKELNDALQIIAEEESKEKRKKHKEHKEHKDKKKEKDTEETKKKKSHSLSTNSAEVELIRSENERLVARLMSMLGENEELRLTVEKSFVSFSFDNGE